jgi:hypothetical protein
LVGDTPRNWRSGPCGKLKSTHPCYLYALDHQRRWLCSLSDNTAYLCEMDGSISLERKLRAMCNSGVVCITECLVELYFIVSVLVNSLVLPVYSLLIAAASPPR